VIVARATGAFAASLTIPVIRAKIGGARKRQKCRKEKQQKPLENSHWIRLEDTALKSR